MTDSETDVSTCYRTCSKAWSEYGVNGTWRSGGSFQGEVGSTETLQLATVGTARFYPTGQLPRAWGWIFFLTLTVTLQVGELCSILYDSHQSWEIETYLTPLMILNNFLGNLKLFQFFLLRKYIYLDFNEGWAEGALMNAGIWVFTSKVHTTDLQMNFKGPTYSHTRAFIHVISRKQRGLKIILFLYALK